MSLGAFKLFVVRNSYFIFRSKKAIIFTNNDVRAYAINGLPNPVIIAVNVN